MFGFCLLEYAQLFRGWELPFQSLTGLDLNVGQIATFFFFSLVAKHFFRWRYRLLEAGSIPESDHPRFWKVVMIKVTDTVKVLLL